MKYIIILILIIGYLPSSAQIQFYSFQEVLDYADSHALAIQSATLSEQITKAEKQEAAANLLPTIGGTLGYNDNITLQPTLVPAQIFNPAAPEGSFEELTFGTKFQYSRGVQVQWDILNFQKFFAYQASKISIDESKAHTEVNRLNTYNQLASTYYSILLTQESIEIYQENLLIGDSILVHAQRKFQDGILSEAEVNRAEIKQRQNQRNLNQAKNNLDQFLVQLQSQLNTEQIISVSDSPESFSLQTTSILAPHPEVIKQEFAVAKYESLLKQAKAMRLPSVSLVYQNNTIWATENFMDFDNSNRLPQQVFGIQINLSEFLGLTTRPKVRQSKWNVQLQHLQLENTKLVKDQEDKLLQLQWEQASDQLRENKRILDLQEQNDLHAENNYQGGLTSLDNRLDTYDDLLVAQDSYLQSLAACTLAQYKIYARQSMGNRELEK
ncbi:MAG: TolC family protein [Bacteroidota bacterium]